MAGGSLDRSAYRTATEATCDSALLIGSEHGDSPPDALRARTRNILVGLSLCLVGVSAGVCVLGAGVSDLNKALINPRLLELQTQQWKHTCGSMDNNIEYRTKTNLYMVFPILSMKSCQSKCVNEPKCVAWTWGKQRGVMGLSDVCMLKGLQPGELPLKSEREGIVSGLICPEQRRFRDADEGGQQAMTTTVPATLVNAGTTIGMGRPADANAVPTVVECSAIEADTEYWSNTMIGKLNHVASADDCRLHCDGDPRCSVWNWVGRRGGVEGNEGVEICWLRRLKEGELLKKVKKTGVFSGWCPTSQRLPAWLAADGSQLSIGEGGSSTMAPMSRASSIASSSANSAPTSTGSGQNTGSKTSFTSTSTRMRAASTKQNATNANGSSTADSRALVLLPWRFPPKRFPDHFEKGSLYCYALMQPTGYEPKLIRLQYQHKASLFGCEEYALYSNLVMDVAPGLQTYAVNSSLKCEVGGEFMTALNLGIFLAVWERVIEVGRYALHDWTVKVDPDCVFFPSRLHASLASRHGGDHAVYINNCRFGMHGPLEVFSRKAVQAWSEGTQQCQNHFTKLCSGDCHWGEDLFIDQCLMKVLKIERISDYNLLAEDHCDPEEGWETCRNQSKTAFHPFKTEEDYLGCLNNGSVHKQGKAVG
eukprot:CAMPEP_0172902144 /NCGR_PEP_ID=MMETSP1075-20121228/167792_1 /TAXON_ID=2916 /ORGANISM="Ceratium fusus, Strain PA161109" /LENGTH=649 /DNA_ID=CAMNT_0013758679 /DNA_START=13 /DNA_END=1962 /DNA_ORIENTATION=-